MKGDSRMKINLVVICLIPGLMASGNALAVGQGKTLEFKANSMGTVIFDGTAHKNAGLTCSDCHNPELFLRMKQGSVAITMADLYAGKFCGKCHNGKKAFLTKDNCTRCHSKLEI